MPRTLKTYVTSVGFFDLAIAAPSMKAALEAWGAERNLFQGGFAKETQDPEIIAATMAKPGVVLKRAIGSSGRFSDQAELPKSLPAERPKEKPTTKKPEKQTGGARVVVNLADERAAREAALAFKKEQAKRARDAEREEAQKARERARREEAVEKAEAAYARARERHETTMRELDAERQAVDRRADAERARWEKEEQKLEAQLRGARDTPH